MLLENAANVRVIDGTVRSIHAKSPNEISAVSVRTVDDRIEELSATSLVIGEFLLFIYGISFGTVVHRLHGRYSSWTKVACWSRIQCSEGYEITI
jgi:hypothetical protein